MRLVVAALLPLLAGGARLVRGKPAGAAAPGTQGAPAAKEASPALLATVAKAKTTGRRDDPQQVKPELDPESSSLFFRHDYPHDQKPPLHHSFDFNHPYPLVQDTDDYDKDYVKDENQDSGEWKAQMDYDTLRTQTFKHKADIDRVKKALDKVNKEYEDAKRAQQEAEKKLAEAQAAYDKAHGKETSDQKKVDDIKASEEEEEKEVASDDFGVDGQVDEVEEKAMTLEECKKQLEEAEKKLKEAEAEHAKWAQKAAEEAAKHKEEMEKKLADAKAAEAEAQKAVDDASGESSKDDKAISDTSKADAEAKEAYESAKKKADEVQAEEDKLKEEELAARKRLHDYRDKQVEKWGHMYDRVEEGGDEGAGGCKCPTQAAAGEAGGESSAASSASGTEAPPPSSGSSSSGGAPPSTSACPPCPVGHADSPAEASGSASEPCDKDPGADAAVAPETAAAETQKSSASGPALPGWVALLALFLWQVAH